MVKKNKIIKVEDGITYFHVKDIMKLFQLRNKIEQGLEKKHEKILTDFKEFFNLFEYISFSGQDRSFEIEEITHDIYNYCKAKRGKKIVFSDLDAKSENLQIIRIIKPKGLTETYFDFGDTVSLRIMIREMVRKAFFVIDENESADGYEIISECYNSLLNYYKLNQNKIGIKVSHRMLTGICGLFIIRYNPNLIKAFRKYSLNNPTEFSFREIREAIHGITDLSNDGTFKAND